jgi:acetyl-CoA synthetase (ADP-forming)
MQNGGEKQSSASETRTLSEHEAKQRLAAAGVPVAPERLAASASEARRAAAELGFPVAVKLCGAGIAHKTERCLVRLDLGDADGVARAAEDLLSLARPEDGAVALLVASMVPGKRELIVGLVRDPTFGACVMLGIGGIFAEALSDVVFRLVPLERVDAEEMLDDLAHRQWLAAFRGEPPVDRDRLVDVLLAIAGLGKDEDIVSIDVNPLILSAGVPVAVDALIEVRR